MPRDAIRPSDEALILKISQARDDGCWCMTHLHTRHGVASTADVLEDAHQRLVAPLVVHVKLLEVCACAQRPADTSNVR